MGPGLAICQICHDEAEGFDPPINCEQESAPLPQDGSFWADAPTDPATCCENFATYEAEYMGLLEEYEEPVLIELRAYMWDRFINCTGITTIYVIP